MKPITVLIAEDHQIVRKGLRNMLTREADIKIVGEAENGRQAVAKFAEVRPDVVLMDIAMPLLNGIEATRQILEAVPGSKVLILSSHTDDAYVIRAKAIGASGYLTKQTAAHLLSRAIRIVHQGNTYFTPPIAQRRNNKKAIARDQGPRPGKSVASLTTREMAVLQFIAQGKSTPETAEQLHISPKTVEKHCRSLMEKLNIPDIGGLTRHAMAAGIIQRSVQVTIL
jgi:DNA-binding NarL/FixJ family response regulator